MKRLSIAASSILILTFAAACSAPLTPRGPGSPASATPTWPVATFPAPTEEPRLPDPTDPPAAEPTAAQPSFSASELGSAIASRDEASLRRMMGDRFLMAYWRSEGREMTRDEAVAELLNSPLGPGSDAVIDFNQDASALLDGADPFAFLPPGLQGVDTIVATSLGANASDEAILYIARDSSGRQVFAGMLTAFGGFHPQGSSMDDLNAVGQQLAQAVQDRDMDALRALMKARFSIAMQDRSLYEYTSEEALAQLHFAFFADGADPVVNFTSDAAAVYGKDPLGEWGPVAQPVKAVHVTGLGAGGKSEAIFVIARDAQTGEYYFHGVLLPANGMKFNAGQTGDVVPSTTQYVVAKDDLNVRAGPGTGYPVIGMVRAGMVAEVRGQKADGSWWWINCTQDLENGCWLSGDPALTEPTALQ